jgi:hypothetical protein
MKNPDLCQRPYCRNPYTKIVSGFKRGRGWTLRVCDHHAADHEGVKDSCGTCIRVTKSEPVPKPPKPNSEGSEGFEGTDKQAHITLDWAMSEQSL